MLNGDGGLALVIYGNGIISTCTCFTWFYCNGFCINASELLFFVRSSIVSFSAWSFLVFKKSHLKIITISVLSVETWYSIWKRNDNCSKFMQWSENHLNIFEFCWQNHWMIVCYFSLLFFFSSCSSLQFIFSVLACVT